MEQRPGKIIGSWHMVSMMFLTLGVALGITAIFGGPSLWDVLVRGVSAIPFPPHRSVVGF